jgi:hypothetical protein
MSQAHPRDLFKFLSPSQIGKGPLDGIAGNPNAAPEVVPLHAFNPDDPAPQLINVIKDFEWTHTPASGRHEVPRIRLSEYRVEFNSILQNLRYLLSTAKDVGNTMLEGSGGIGKAVGVQNAANAAAKKAKEPAKKSKIMETFEAGKTAMNAGIEILDRATINSTGVAAHLQPYYGLYGVQPTGFEYVLPYFDSDWRSVGTNWTSIDGKGGLLGGFITEATDVATDIVDTMAVLPNVKGAGIERSKMYSYGQDEPQKTIKFTLLNTNNFDDVVKNWQLAFMLLYQNLPNKISKVAYEPPVIYEVEVPGQFYTPFAYITQIAVVNRGATRTMKIPVLYDEMIRDRLHLDSPGDDRYQNNYNAKLDGTAPRHNRSNTARNQKPTSKPVQGKSTGGATGGPDPKTEYIETIIPDAYDITITVKSLIPESKNLLFHSTLGPQTSNSGLYSVNLKGTSDERDGPGGRTHEGIDRPDLSSDWLTPKK